MLSMLSAYSGIASLCCFEIASYCCLFSKEVSSLYRLNVYFLYSRSDLVLAKASLASRGAVWTGAFMLSFSLRFMLLKKSNMVKMIGSSWQISCIVSSISEFSFVPDSEVAEVV